MNSQKISYPKLPPRKKPPPIKHLISRDFFFHNYDKLYKALIPKNKKISQQHWLSLVEPTVPVVPYEKRLHKSKSVKMIPETTPNVSKEIATAFKEYTTKTKQTTKEYETFNNANNTFLSMYRSLKRSQSAIEIQKKYIFMKRDEDDPDRKRLSEEQSNKLFKKSPLLIHSKNEMDLHFVGNTEWVNPNELKYIKSMNNMKDFLEYKALMNSQSDDIKVNNSNYVKNFYKNIELEKIRVKKEYNEKIKQRINTNLNEINKTKESLLTLKAINGRPIENINNKNALYKKKNNKVALLNNEYSTLHKKPNTNVQIVLNESPNQSVTSFYHQSNQKNQLNSTSSTQFSPNNTVKNTSCNNNKRHLSLKYYTKSRTMNNNLSFLSKQTFTPTNTSKLISLFPSNISSNNNETTEKNKEEEPSSQKPKNNAVSSEHRKKTMSKVESVYNKIQSASNIGESTLYIQQYIGKDIVNKWLSNPKHKSQIYFLINSAKLKANSSNIKGNVYKLYDSQVPQKTKFKFEVLSDAENTINKFDFKFFKAIIDSNIK